MTVDGTDFMICEPTPFNPIWYSKKFDGPGLRYEVGISIQTGWICWVGGAFLAGEFPDQEIFKIGLMNYLDDGERVEVDAGYTGNLPIRPKCDYGGNDVWRIMKGAAWARHKTINRNLKEFGILRQRFRHARHKHRLIMFAVCAITQSEILDGRGTFNIDYCIVRQPTLVIEDIQG